MAVKNSPRFTAAAGLTVTATHSLSDLEKAGLSKNPMCVYSHTRTSNSSFGIPFFAWKLCFKICSKERKYPLKICPVGDDNHLIFHQENNSVYTMQHILAASVEQRAHTQRQNVMNQWLNVFSLLCILTVHWLLPFTLSNYVGCKWM